MRDKDLVNYQSGYQGLGTFAIVLIVVIAVWGLWLSGCEHRAMQNFDRAMGIGANR